MCDDNCTHNHDEVQDQCHTSQENKDLADISRYLEDDVLKDQNPIKLPAFIQEAKAWSRSKRLEKENQLGAIKINKSHVDILMNELDLSKVAAERMLRANDGDLKAKADRFYQKALACVCSL